MAVMTTKAVAVARARRSRRLMGRVLLYLAMALGTLLFLGPMAWALVSSFKPENELYGTFWPASFTTSAYTDSFAAVSYIGRAFFNSFFDYGIVTAGALVFSSMAGYALARLNFIGRTALFNLILFTMTIPAMLTL